MRAHVRFGSLGDIRRQLTDVRFTPNSGHRDVSVECDYVPEADMAQRLKT